MSAADVLIVKVIIFCAIIGVIIGVAGSIKSGLCGADGHIVFGMAGASIGASLPALAICIYWCIAFLFS